MSTSIHITHVILFCPSVLRSYFIPFLEVYFLTDFSFQFTAHLVALPSSGVGWKQEVRQARGKGAAQCVGHVAPGSSLVPSFTFAPFKGMICKLMLSFTVVVVQNAAHCSCWDLGSVILHTELSVNVRSCITAKHCL